jgi:hypothetical protein
MVLTLNPRQTRALAIQGECLKLPISRQNAVYFVCQELLGSAVAPALPPGLSHWTSAGISMAGTILFSFR